MRHIGPFLLTLLLFCLVDLSRCRGSDINVSKNNLDTKTSIFLRSLSSADAGKSEETEKKKHHDKRTRHKALLPLNGRDIGGFILAALGLLVAAGGGIGGGGILVPIYTLIIDFDSKFAIPLANISVFGGAIANVLLNSTKRHPAADRPLIDWNLILVMEPLTIAGALIGAILNKVLPGDVLVIMLVIVLSITADRTLKKAKKMYEKENEERVTLETSGYTALTEEASENVPEVIIQPNESYPNIEQDTTLTGTNSLSVPLLNEINNNEAKTNTNSETFQDSVANNSKLQEILEEERYPPFYVVLAIVVLFVVVVVLNVLKGGGGKESPVGIHCGSLWFWLIQLFMLIWIVIIALVARLYLLEQTKLKEEANYTYVEGDIVWDERSTLIYPAICSAAGLCAGMFGIGGGIVKGPLMLAMGVHPKVAAATSATMILFTSFTATTSFMVFGLLQYDYAYVVTVIGFLATLIGQTVMNELIKKTGRNSYIVYVIGIVVLVSACAMVLKVVFSVEKASVEKAKSGDADDISFCSAGA